MLSLQANSLSAMSSLEKVGLKLKEIEAADASDPLTDLEEVELLNELQNFILQAAAISRYFWPVKKTHDWRGSDLRRRLDVSDESPLRSRDLRNELEHFDERLDVYLENGIVGNIIPQYVGPEPEKQQVPLHIFRAYYFDKGIFYLLGKKHKIIPLAREVHRIHGRLIGSTNPNV